MADFVNEQIEEAEYHRDLWRMGHFSVDEAIELGIIDEHGNDGFPSPPKIKTKTCRQCGKTGLHWGQAKTGWRLFDKLNKIHNCSKKNET